MTWWFQISLFLSLLGEMIHSDSYFSDGSKPPTKKDFLPDNFVGRFDRVCEDRFFCTWWKELCGIY